jgi:tetratricopeptide (TPR) repeat protein
MKLSLVAVCALLVCGGARLPVEHALLLERTQQHLHSAPPLELSLREQLGQLGFVAALGGFRSLAADFLFIQAHVAWERTEWSRVLTLLRQTTTLQPHAILFWDMAAWHMAWNASAAALNDPAQPRLALRIKAQREYFDLGKDFLERGIRNNPGRPQLYEALARLYRDKYKDHARAAEFFARAAEKPDAPSYAKRFSAYELSFCEGREQEAYEKLMHLYSIGESERLPTLISRLKFLEDKLNIPPAQRIVEDAKR